MAAAGVEKRREEVAEKFGAQIKSLAQTLKRERIFNARRHVGSRALPEPFSNLSFSATSDVARSEPRPKSSPFRLTDLSPP
jgi:hypothetical protein